MSQLTTYPLADGFKATLDQSYNGTGTTIYSDDVPNITRPSGVSTYLVLAPKTSNQQIVKISGMDSIAKTFTVSSTTVKKGAGTNYSTSTHAIGTEIIISSNYAFWEDIKTAINDNDTRITTNATNITTINNTINSNINTIQAGSYISANSNDVDDAYDATLSPVIASYTDKMMVNIKFSTVNTGACTLNLNGLGAKSIKTKDGNDPQNGVIREGIHTLVYEANDDIFILQDEDFATTTNKGIVELATTAETLAGSDTARAVTPSGLNAVISQYGIILIAGDTYNAANMPTSRSTTSGSYQTLKSCVINHSGTYKIYMETNYPNGLGQAPYEIRRNGTAILSGNHLSSDPSWSARTINITLNAGDSIQFGGSDGTFAPLYIRNARVSYSYDLVLSANATSIVD